MRLLVYEHLSGGGYADQRIPMDILCEGFGMLRSLTSDFHTAGHHVTTMLDTRIAKLKPPLAANTIVPISSSHEILPNILTISNQVDACYVVAPETNGTLASLTKTIEKTKATPLNCPAKTIEKLSDKWMMHDFLRKKGFNTPQTLRFKTNVNPKEIKQTVKSNLTFPVITKPQKDASCCGISVANNEEHLDYSIKRIRRESTNKDFLVQELIKGTDVSISLLATSRKALAIDLNFQEIKLKTPRARLRYCGGMIPFDNPLKAEAIAIAKKIVRLLPEFKGYLGIDFVLTRDKAVPIEVNLRLTTSYIGLSQVVKVNLAQAIINAVLKNEIPTKIETREYTIFSKTKTPKPHVETLKKIYKTKEIVSPPFPISDNGAALAMIISNGPTQNEAKRKLRETKKRLLKITKRW